MSKQTEPGSAFAPASGSPTPCELRLSYTVEEAMQDAAYWSNHMTLHAESRGWRVAAMLLREEVLRLRKDKARLDWLDAIGGNIRIEELIPWEDSTNTVVASSHGDIRWGIDRAMKSENARLTDEPHINKSTTKGEA